MEGGRVPVLSVRGLWHEFRTSRKVRGRSGAQVLRGVDLDIFEGECLGLVGESGSGKTTLARALLRLVVPSSGSVLFKGADVLGMSKGELQAFRRKVQIVFQDPFGSLNPRLTAGGMLDEVLRVHSRGDSREERGRRVEDLLGLVGLTPEVAFRYPHEFSGGQRQRLGIARALAVEPEVLILDEPVSALDLSVQAQILNLLGDLRETLGLTYMFVTHDLSVVRHVAERVAVLYLGRVVEEGPTQAVLTDPLHPYTRGLLAAADLGSEPGVEAASGQAWELLPGETPSPFAPPTGCALHPRCPHPSKDEECSVEVPPLQAHQAGHHAACWKVWKHLANP